MKLTEDQIILINTMFELMGSAYGAIVDVSLDYDEKSKFITIYVSTSALIDDNKIILQQKADVLWEMVCELDSWLRNNVKVKLEQVTNLEKPKNLGWAFRRAELSPKPATRLLTPLEIKYLHKSANQALKRAEELWEAEQSEKPKHCY